MQEHIFWIEPPAPFDLRLSALVLQRSPANRLDRLTATGFSRLLDPASTDLTGTAAPAVGPWLLEVEQVAPCDHPQLKVRLRGPLGDARAAEATARRALAHLLGLEVDLSGFYALASSDAQLGALVASLPGLRPQRYLTLFEALLNCISCQQVSLAAGLSALSRLAEAYGPRLTIDGHVYAAPPAAATVAALEPEALRACGYSRRKAEYLIGLAQALCSGALTKAELEEASNDAVARRLTALRGLGRWSAQYVMLRGLGRLDVFPVDDVGAARNLARWLGLGDKPLPAAQVEALTARWKPYRGMLYFYLLARKRMGTGD